MKINKNMALPDLTNLFVADSYQGVLHTATVPLQATNLAPVYDGLGNKSSLRLNSDGNGATVNGGLSANSLAITDNATVGRSLSANSIGVTTNMTVGGDILVNTLRLTGDANIIGDVTIQGSIQGNPPAMLGGVTAISINAETIYTSEDALIGGDLVTIGKSTTNGDATIGGNTVINGNATIASDASVSGNMTVSGDANFNQRLAANRLAITGNATVGQTLSADSLRILSNAVVNGGANIGGDVFIGGCLTVDCFKIAGYTIVDYLYPVGAVYLDTFDVNPQTRFTGTTWTKISEGKFLAGVGTGVDKNLTNQAFSAGDDVSIGEYGHRLTVAELPSHTHKPKMRYMSGNDDNAGYSGYMGSSTRGLGDANVYGDDLNPPTLQIDSVGSDQRHNNIPPYFGVYIWKRIA